MSEDEQTEQFANELDRLVDRFRDEYDMMYASIVGTLFFKAHNLMVECQEQNDKDDQNEKEEE